MEKKFVSVNGHEMAYMQMGEGRPIVFLHGNPTSSYLWRDVIPEVAALGKCIAPDLIGMGDSAKLPQADAQTYDFFTHRSFFDGFMRALGLNEDVVLVVHDWGSALGFNWAHAHQESVRGIVYMEGIVQPFENWAAFNEEAAPLFQALRLEAGHALICDKNVFIERILRGSILRDLSEAEMDVYRAPFIDPAHRFPMLTWPRSIPVAGSPADVSDVVQTYADWMAVNKVPKLFVDASPGAILTGAARDFCRSWSHQTEVQVKGSHFIQEDSGSEIGRAISAWIQKAAI